MGNLYHLFLSTAAALLCPFIDIFSGEEKGSFHYDIEWPEEGHTVFAFANEVLANAILFLSNGRTPTHLLVDSSDFVVGVLQ